MVKNLFIHFQTYQEIPRNIFGFKKKRYQQAIKRPYTIEIVDEAGELKYRAMFKAKRIADDLSWASKKADPADYGHPKPSDTIFIEVFDVISELSGASNDVVVWGWEENLEGLILPEKLAHLPVRVLNKISIAHWVSSGLLEKEVDAGNFMMYINGVIENMQIGSPESVWLEVFEMLQVHKTMVAFRESAGRKSGGAFWLSKMFSLVKTMAQEGAILWFFDPPKYVVALGCPTPVYSMNEIAPWLKHSENRHYFWIING